MMATNMYEDTNTEQFAAVAPAAPAWPSAVAGRQAATPKPKKVRRWPWALAGLLAGIAIGTASHPGAPAVAAAAAPVVAAPATTAPAPEVQVPTPVAAAPAPVVAEPVVEAPAAPAAPAGPLTSFGNGTYEVGVDVAPGKYKSAGVADSIAPLCYFDQTDAGGAIKDQGAANEGPSRATLRAGLTFKSSGCQQWEKVG